MMLPLIYRNFNLTVLFFINLFRKLYGNCNHSKSLVMFVSHLFLK